jgi:hypothetical protein
MEARERLEGKLSAERDKEIRMTTGKKAENSGFEPPWRRGMVVPLEMLLGPESALREAWEFSGAQLRDLNVGMTNILEKGESKVWEAVGVSGSFGRMEGGSGSDLDVMRFLREEMAEEELSQADAELKKVMVARELKSSSGKGIFAKPLVRGELFAAPIGQIDEGVRPFGMRIQLLLDGQPVWGVLEFRNLQREVLRRYLTPAPLAEREECWETLVHDLGRYFRSLSLKYLWEDRENFSRWGVRNLKGWFSRPLMQISLLMLLGESLARERDPEAWVAARLHLTPWERLGISLPQRDLERLRPLVVEYEAFLKCLAQPETREHFSEEVFREQRVRAGRFQEGLVELLMSAAEKWPRGFRRRLVL